MRTTSTGEESMEQSKSNYDSNGVGTIKKEKLSRVIETIIEIIKK